MPAAPHPLLTDLLRDVSRSFYLTLQVLPATVRAQIGTAYLLARLTDTVADTGLVSIERRLAALRQLRQRIAGESNAPFDFGELANAQGSDAERVLLTRAEEAFGLVDQFDPEDQRLIKSVLRTITSGQELDLERFGAASAQSIISLKNATELDDYTYRVAGCVGEFWTHLCRRHLFPQAPVDSAELLSKGVRFGKGLQLVNVLRDLPKDLRQGRCYLPGDELASVDLRPEDLIESRNELKVRPVYNQHLSEAQAHLAEGWRYTLMLPYSCVRVRLACAWPVLIGLETISLLRKQTILGPQAPIKVSRARVKRIMANTILTYPFPPVWRSLGNQSPVQL